MTDTLSVTLSGVAGADGTAEAVYTVPMDRPFAITRLSCSGTTLVGNRVPAGQLRVYVNGELIDGTARAAGDASDWSSPLQLNVSDQIRAAWSGAPPGATFSLVIRGDRY